MSSKLSSNTIIQISKNPESLIYQAFRDLRFGGAGGIRTHVPLRTNGFQDRLVMTTSIQLRVPEYFTVFLLGFQQFHVEGLFSASFTRLYLHLNTATPIIIAYPTILKGTGISCRKRMPRSAANTT